jgi:hypothetical protein
VTIYILENPSASITGRSEYTAMLIYIQTAEAGESGMRRLGNWNQALRIEKRVLLGQLGNGILIGYSNKTAGKKDTNNERYGANNLQGLGVILSLFS